LFDLSPLTTNHFKFLQQLRIQPWYIIYYIFGLFMAKSIGFGFYFHNFFVFILVLTKPTFFKLKLAVKINLLVHDTKGKLLFRFWKTKLQQIINIKFHALFTSKKDSFQLSFTVLFTIDYKRILEFEEWYPKNIQKKSLLSFYFLILSNLNSYRAFTFFCKFFMIFFVFKFALYSKFVFARHYSQNLGWFLFSY